jgi:hypothetical protein
LTITNYYLQKRLNNGVQLEDFLNIVQNIRNVHNEFDKELEDRVKNYSDNPYVFDIFEKYLSKFKYDKYIDNFENSFQILIDLIEKSNDFAQYLNHQNEIVRI